MKKSTFIAAGLFLILILLSSCSHGYNPLDKVESIPRDYLVWSESKALERWKPLCKEICGK